jgi:2-keto-4-pentenoate hydratase
MNLQEYYYDARITGTGKENLPRPDSLQHAYQIQTGNCARLGTIGGWKLGGTNLSTRIAFSTVELYCGPIFTDSIFNVADKIVLPENVCSPVGELEVCFRLNEGVQGHRFQDCSPQQALNFVTSMHLGIEMPWTAFSFPDEGLKALIADCCASGPLILSNAIGIPEVFTDNPVVLGIRSGELSRGSTADIIGGPLEALSNFFELSTRLNLDISAGQFIATGGCCPCVPLPFGETISANFGSLGEFEFILDIAGEL